MFNEVRKEQNEGIMKIELVFVSFHLTTFIKI